MERHVARPPASVPLVLWNELVRFVAGLGRSLGGSLVGAYAGGSIALDDFVPGRSDADVSAVTQRDLTNAEREELAEWVVSTSLEISARGIEFVLYSLRDLDSMPAQTLFQVNVNAGRRMATHIATDAAGEPDFWFPLDIAILRQKGLALAGPASAAVFPELPRTRLLAALVRATEWYGASGDAPSAVLAACRALRYSRTDTWVSKSSAGEWARRKLPRHQRTVDLALAAHHGKEMHRAVDEGEAEALVEEVRKELVAGLDEARSGQGHDG